MPVLTERPAGPATRPRAASPARVVAALARFEGRKLHESPIVLGSVALTLATLFAGQGGDWAVVLDRDDVTAAVSLTILAWGVLLAANLAALRSRRDRAGELLSSLPVSASSRTAGQLLATAALLPVAVALPAAWWLQARLGSSVTVGAARPAELAVAPLLLLGGGVTGVLVARWVPTALVGPAAVLATIVLQVNWGDEQYELRWLHFVAWEPAMALDPWLDIRHAGWHLVYLLGLVVVAGMLAMARHGLTRSLAAVAAVAVATTLVAGWVQTRPATAAQVAAIVDHLYRPEAYQVCEDRAGVRFCAYPTYRDWIDDWEVPVRGVLARLPAAVRERELLVRQRVRPDNVTDLHPLVLDRLDPARVWPADGAVHPGLEWYTPGNPAVVLPLQRGELALAHQVAAWAVGLPPTAARPGWRCVAAGQARTVLAMWLAGQATPGAGRALRERAATVGYGSALTELATLDDYPGPDGMERFMGEPGWAGHGADVVAAARLLDLPRDRVAGVAAARWERLTDPATPAGELLAAVGLAAPSTPARRAAGPAEEGPACP
jgi:hypothetical protein